MATTTIGFAVADEDRQALAELVEYFGNGNRSAYLRATLKVMKSVQLAERLRDVQAYGQTKLAASGHSLDDIPDLVRQATKGPH
ncbi:MAG TPA: hypothetical protein VGJ38_10145 [Jatrophihabitantaceae bacterium]|jgi:hypothetical protein